MKLNRTPNPLNRDARNKENENWDTIQQKFNNVVEEVSDAAFQKVIDGSKIDWEQMVDKVSDLPSNVETGETRGVKEDNKIYRFNGTDWIPIAEINLNPIAEVDQRLTTQLAETDKHRHFESMINRKEPGLLISITDDDGHALVYDRFKPLMEDYNIPITEALITSEIDGVGQHPMLTKEQRDELEDLGMEFISHTHYHDTNFRPVDMTDEQLDEDFRKTVQVMKEHGYNHRGLILPFGDNSEGIQRVGRRYFDYIIGTANATYGRPALPSNMDNYYIWRITLTEGFNHVKNHIDNVKNNGMGWVELGTHIYDDSVYSESYYRQIIEYALSQGFEFVRTDEGIKRMGNIAQYEDTHIGADGKVYGVTVREKEKDTVTRDTTLADFDRGITITKITGAMRDKGWVPDGAQGILITYKLDSSDGVSYQEFKKNNMVDKYIRTGLSDGNFSPWTKLTTVHMMPDDSLVGTETIDDFESGISIVTITGVTTDRSWLPNNSGGMLITYKGSRDAYSYQEFKKNNDGDKYIRSVVGSGWGVWKKYMLEEV